MLKHCKNTLHRQILGGKKVDLFKITVAVHNLLHGKYFVTYDLCIIKLYLPHKNTISPWSAWSPYMVQLFYVLTASTSMFQCQRSGSLTSLVCLQSTLVPLDLAYDLLHIGFSIAFNDHRTRDYLLSLAYTTQHTGLASIIMDTVS